MNRREFLSALITELKNIEPSELQDVLQYYNEYFDEAGIENEAAVIAELGSPKVIAAGIKSNVSIKYLETDETNTKKSLKAVWISIGAVFAAPIALPIALAVVMILFSIVIVWGSLLFSLYAVSFSFALTGILLAIISIFLIPTSIPTFLVMFGTSLILVGLAILVVIPTLILTRKSFKWLAIFINRKILKKGNHSHEKT